MQETNRTEVIVLILFGIAAPFVLGSNLMIFNDGDVHWHIAAGRWMIEHRALPTADPFSFSFAGAKWVPFEWLSQLLYGAAYGAAGFAAVSALATLALVALHLVVVSEARRHVGPWGIAATVALMDLTLIPMMLSRPHLLAWPVFALWLSILLRAREHGRAPPLAAALLVVLWANLHASWALGISIAAFVALDQVIERRREREIVWRWLLFGLLSTAAALVTPNGIEGFLHPLNVSKMETLPLVLEWRPSNLDRTPFFFVAVAITAGLGFWRGIRIRPVVAILLVLLVAMALHQMRHQALLAIAAALILPKAMSKSARRPLLAHRANVQLIAASVAAMVFALLLFRVSRPLEPAENGANPVSAIAAIPADLRTRPGLNGYSFGGPLIRNGVKVFIDGRQDMYGDAFVREYQAMVDGDGAALDRAIARYQLQWSMLPPRYAKFIANLDRKPEWKRVYVDRNAVIHRRTKASA